MENQVIETIYEMLDTINEAIMYLKHTENAEVREALILGRQQVTQELEKALSCSLEQRIDIWHLSDEDWLITVYRILEEILNPFQPKNAFDIQFVNLLNYIWNNDKQSLLQTMMHWLMKKNKQDYQNFIEYFEKYSFWGSFNIEKKDITALKLRADVLKQHSYDFLWLYRRLEDYLSKYSLFAILLNWAFLETEDLTKVKSLFPDYWEPDIFPDNKDDVLVDLGAFTGDSIAQYIAVYGTNYRKIYAYEISEDSYTQLCENTAQFHDIINIRKGAGKEKGKLFLEENQQASANRLSQMEGDMQNAVEVVALDEDIDEPITFLKMDIEGAEQDALLGCQNIIQTQHPKLAVCLYHGYEDLWKIPTLIDSMNPDYHFYLRHYGGDLIPTEFVLLCKP